MNYKEKIIKEYPLTSKVDCELDCYLLDKRRYLVFCDILINRASIGEILSMIQEKTNSSKFPEWKTFIVFGITDEEFKKKELFYFDGVNTFAVFYLVNEKENKVFANDSWIYVLGCNYKKYVKKINGIVAPNHL